MSRQESKVNIEEHLLHETSRSLSSPYLLASKQASSNSVVAGAPTTTGRPIPPFKRFWMRTLVTIIIPPVVTAYFYWIWLYILRPGSKNSVNYGGKHEDVHYYLWFVVSVFGLGVSKFGLAGVEAAMLQSPYWKAPNAAALLMHGGSSWSGPGGWPKVLKRLIRGKKHLAHRQWLLLAVLSLCPFVALPISGLCMELLSDGHVPSVGAPKVIGHTWEDFNRRQEDTYYSNAAKGWELGSPSTIPGFGVIYTPEHLPRREYSDLQHVPNALPLDEDIPDMFLAPQAKNPVSGKTWGLRAGYNCSTVKDVSEFTILGQKSSSEFLYDWTREDNTTEYIALKTPSEQNIFIFTGTDPKASVNLFGYIEMGVSNTIPSTYNGTEPSSFDTNDIEKADILEYSLWQMRVHSLYGNDDPDFNNTLSPIVEGIGQPYIQAANGSYVVNETFFQFQTTDGEVMSSRDYGIPNENPTRPIISLAPPIGIRCHVLSTLGTAELNPQKSTFCSFQQMSNPPFNQTEIESAAPRLGDMAMQTMRGRYLDIFASINAPAPITISNSYSYQNFIHPENLRKSIMLAYAKDALQLMYDGTYGFEGAWSDTNLTSSKSGRILTMGRVSPAVPAIILTVWAVGCVFIGSWFGFRPRWTDSLDGFRFFQFGVEMADEVKHEPDILSTREFDQIDRLRSLPGPARVAG